MKKAILAASLLLVGGLAFGPSAKANYVLDLTQVGSNVVVNGSGTIDLTGLTYVATSGPSVSFLDPSYGTVTTGSAGATPEDFTGFTGPTTFGTGATLRLAAAVGTMSESTARRSTASRHCLPCQMATSPAVCCRAAQFLTMRRSRASALRPAPTCGRGEQPRTVASRSLHPCHPCPNPARLRCSAPPLSSPSAAAAVGAPEEIDN
jgi:hypothetical protein